MLARSIAYVHAVTSLGLERSQNTCRYPFKYIVNNSTYTCTSKVIYSQPSMYRIIIIM